MSSDSIMLGSFMQWPDAIYNHTTLYLDVIWTYIESLDIDYIKWVLWVIYPIILSFLLPLLLLVFIYGSALFLQLYRRRHRLRDAYARDFWNGARNTLAAVWEGQGRIWHGFDIVGLDKIPDQGPALIIYYHGVIPIDFYYVIAKTILEKGRQIRAVGDRFLFKVPGWRLMMEVFCVTPGTVQSCVEVLNKGHILAIAPGGVREALFGNEYYRLMWGKRVGFAKIAMQAGVPVIPMFTKNCREVFRTPSWGRYWLRKVYEKTRLPIVPIYGGFPVKMRTYFGDPVYPDENSSPEEFAKKVHDAVNDLIIKHQRVPGNILHGLWERVVSPKEKTS